MLHYWLLLRVKKEFTYVYYVVHNDSGILLHFYATVSAPDIIINETNLDFLLCVQHICICTI